MNLRKFLVPVVFALVAILVTPFALHPAEAHITKTFNNVTIKIGWVNEPPLVGDANAVQIFIYNGTSDNAPPIADTGLDNMTTTIQYGGQTKVVSFDPSDDTPGEYDAAVNPTQIGTYNMIIQGTIGGTTIPSTTYPLQDVEAKDAYYFPAMTSMSGMNMTGNSTMSGNQTVPEFGPVASLVLVIAIISVVVVTGRTRGFLKF
ncbi:MAG: PEFG-CTERM sorting domain-containing protein [Nitrosotalea sp.]